MPEKAKISSEEASRLLYEGRPLRDFHIEGILDLHKLGNSYTQELIITNCIIENLESYSIEFTKAVILINSTFNNCTFAYSFFPDGLFIQNCIFERHLDFEAGGHNKKVITIKGNIFKEFVNCFDCWYQAAVYLTDNIFLKGSNIMGNKGKGFEATFDTPPIITDNIGKLDVDGGVDKNSDTIGYKK